jgi:hypothetical protein
MVGAESQDIRPDFDIDSPRVAEMLDVMSSALVAYRMCLTPRGVIDLTGQIVRVHIADNFMVKSGIALANQYKMSGGDVDKVLESVIEDSGLGDKKGLPASIARSLADGLKETGATDLADKVSVKYETLGELSLREITSAQPATS